MTENQRPRLTNREFDVLKLLARGDTNAMMAKKLCISEGAVQSRISKIFFKTNAVNRTHAAALAYELGYLDLPTAEE